MINLGEAFCQRQVGIYFVAPKHPQRSTLMWFMLEFFVTPPEFEGLMLLGIRYIVGHAVFLGWFRESRSDTFNGFMLFLPIWVAIRFGSTIFVLNMIAIQALSAA
jgi:hypothetical protein